MVVPGTASATGSAVLPDGGSLLALLVEGFLVLPIVGVLVLCLRRAPPALVTVVPASVAYGGLVWWLGRRAAVRWVWWRQPELLAAIMLRQAE